MPAASPTQMARLRRLIRRQSLEAIRLTIHDNGVSASAIPSGFHPKVAERRNKALASYPDGVTLAQADDIRAASMAPVATASGDSVDDALILLGIALGAPKP